MVPLVDISSFVNEDTYDCLPSRPRLLGAGISLSRPWRQVLSGFMCRTASSCGTGKRAERERERDSLRQK